MLQVNRFIAFNKILQKILVIIVDLWYNKDVVFLGDIDIMFNKFDFDIEYVVMDPGYTLDVRKKIEDNAKIFRKDYKTRTLLKLIDEMDLIII